MEKKYLKKIIDNCYKADKMKIDEIRIFEKKMKRKIEYKIFEKIINDYNKYDDTEVLFTRTIKIKREFGEKKMNVFVVGYLNSFKQNILYFFFNKDNGKVLQYCDFTTQELKKILEYIK